MFDLSEVKKNLWSPLSGHLQHGGRRRDRIWDRLLGKVEGTLEHLTQAWKNTQATGEKLNAWPEKTRTSSVSSMAFHDFSPKLHSFGLLVWDGGLLRRFVTTL